MKVLKISLFTLAFFMLSLTITTCYAQDNYKASMDGWLVNMDEAYEVSQASGKPVLANFTGTDWCIWCKRLRADVFEKEEFKKWAEDNVILLELDFPRRTTIPQRIKEQNNNLARLFKVRGYPTVWFFNLNKNDEGKFNIEALGSTGYKRSVGEFISDAERIMNNAKTGK